MSIFSEIFSWWGGSTWGTRYTLWRQGQLVGRDAFGNRYYEQAHGKGPLGRPRRWVIFPKMSEPSQVPADWHGWLHHTYDTLPTDERYEAKPWQKPHVMNGTGTRAAYRPSGSILASGQRPKATGDYKPWQPD